MILKYNHLKGRPFKLGETDCYSLAMDFYKDNFGIELTDYARPNEFWKTLNLYNDNFRREGFEVVGTDLRDIRPADAILMAIRGKHANHVAIYVGDGQILNHFYDRLSVVESLKGIWRNTLTAILRHNSLTTSQPIPKSVVDVTEFLPAHIRNRMDLERARKLKETGNGNSGLLL